MKRVGCFILSVVRCLFRLMYTEYLVENENPACVYIYPISERVKAATQNKNNNYSPWSFNVVARDPDAGATYTYV